MKIVGDGQFSVILRRGPKMEDITYRDTTFRRATSRAYALGDLHNARVEQNGDMEFVVYAEKFYN